MSSVADAIRRVTASIQRAIDAGQRSRAIDADDLIAVLLAVADELDPPLGSPPRELVAEAAGCPQCGERDPDRLVWQDDETVRCSGCGRVYQPG